MAASWKQLNLSAAQKPWSLLNGSTVFHIQASMGHHICLDSGCFFGQQQHALLGGKHGAWIPETRCLPAMALAYFVKQHSSGSPLERRSNSPDKNLVDKPNRLHQLLYRGWTEKQSNQHWPWSFQSILNFSQNHLLLPNFSWSATQQLDEPSEQHGCVCFNTEGD